MHVKAKWTNISAARKAEAVETRLNPLWFLSDPLTVKVQMIGGHNNPPRSVARPDETPGHT